MWEALREGVDDLKYINMLASLIEQGKSYRRPEEWPVKKAAEKAQKVLDRVISSIDVALIKEECHSIESKWDVEGSGYVGGRYLLPNGWDFEDYDRARKDVANEILELKKLIRE